MDPVQIVPAQEDVFNFSPLAPPENVLADATQTLEAVAGILQRSKVYLAAESRLVTRFIEGLVDDVVELAVHKATHVEVHTPSSVTPPRKRTKPGGGNGAAVHDDRIELDAAKSVPADRAAEEGGIPAVEEEEERDDERTPFHQKQTLNQVSDIHTDQVKQMCRELNIRYQDYPDTTGIVKIYEVDSYWECAYPYLFPYGRGGPQPCRRNGVPMTNKQWNAHAFTEKSQRFSTCVPFMFSLYMQLMRAEASHIAFLAYKFGGKTETSLNVTDDEVRVMLDFLKSGSGITKKVQEESKHLMD
jgi:hypothetical protein